MREYRVSIMDVICLLENTIICKDNDVDTKYTADDLIGRLKSTFITLPIDQLESYLYMCNMNREDGVYTHPEKKAFTLMVKDILPRNQKFCSINNFIKSK